jgi:hypothetical protein
MKKKTFSIFILMVLTLSMVFSSYTPINNALEITNEPIPAAKPTNTILDVGDALYYNVIMGGYDEMDDRYYEDNVVVKLVVNATDTTYITYMPYFYKYDGTNWAWEEDPSEHDDPHMKDDYNYLAFNHSWSVATDVIEMWDVNQTEDIEGLFGDAMSSSVVNADFSTGSDTYHNITLACDRDDNSSTPVFVEWIGDKTTGLCLSYIETGIDDNITAELCGYEIFALSTPLPTPTSYGFAVGDWIDYFVPESERYDDPPQTSGDSYYYDWLERGNDDWSNAFYLNNEFEVPGHWHDLTLHDNYDYYSFHAESGDNIVVDAWCDMGADIRLEELDSTNGNLIQSDGEDGDTDGWIHLDWTASYSGEYIIGFTSDFGPFSDWYDFQISINGFYGPDYFPDGGPDDGPDGPDSMFIRQTMEYIYTNPLGEDVLVIKSEGHKDADMMDTPLFVEYREQGRIDPSEINKIEGPYFHKDLDMTSGAFQTSMEDMFTQDGNVITTFNTDANWFEMLGITDEGADFYFFVERFADHNYGTIQYYEQSEYNATEGYYIKKDKQMAIGSSITGLINDVVPELGVSVGDWWEYLAQEEGYENNWEATAGYSRSFENVHYVKVTVTHVFHVNRTVVAVIAEMDHYSNDDPDFPDHREFMPLLVWNTEDPMSFFNMGGHGRLEDGPPFLLPAGVDWSLLEGEFTTMMESFMDEGNELKINIDTNSVRISWEGDDGDDRRERGNVFLDINSNGIVTYIAQEDYKRDNNYERRNRLEGFAVDISLGCSRVPSSDVTDVVTGDVFVWENQRYHPAGMWGPDDPGEDPAHFTHLRNQILTVESACDEFIVFLGSIEMRQWNETDYRGRTWKYWDEDAGNYVDSGINSWLLGSIQDGNIWSWVNSQYFDKGIENFTSYEADLVELLNFVMELPPGITITPADVTVSGLTFEVILSFEETPGGGIVDHIMSIAVNNKGIMQEMFRGSRDSSDTWLEWEYTVLIDAPDGYDTGGVLPDLPVEDPSGLEGGDPSPFDIPGYSTTMVMVVSIFAIFSLIALISNRRR